MRQDAQGVKTRRAPPASRAAALLFLALAAVAVAATAGQRRGRGEALPAPVTPAGPATERDCLMEYVRLRADEAAALAVLSDCASRFPESFSIALTLGRRLAEGPPGDAARQAEAGKALERAAAIDPAQFADDWLLLARLQDARGDGAAATKSYRAALPFLEPGERAEVANRLFTRLVESGDDAGVASCWRLAWHLRADDADAQLAAGRSLLATGELVAARAATERALELRPGDAGARAQLDRIVERAAAAGGALDRAGRLEHDLARLAELPAAQLVELLDAARDAMRPLASQRIAEELLRRDPRDGTALVVLAEGAWADGRAADARRLAERALGGSVAAAWAASARSIVGRAVVSDAHDRFARAGAGATPELLASTAAAYRDALRHFEAAERAGASVARDVEAARSALQAMEELCRATAPAAPAGPGPCGDLAARARYLYDADRPLRRRAGAALTLSRAPGAAADLGTLAAGASVAVQDAEWSAATQSCWFRVRADDGTAGWAPASAFLEG